MPLVNTVTKMVAIAAPPICSTPISEDAVPAWRGKRLTDPAMAGAMTMPLPMAIPKYGITMVQGDSNPMTASSAMLPAPTRPTSNPKTVQRARLTLPIRRVAR